MHISLLLDTSLELKSLLSRACQRGSLHSGFGLGGWSQLLSLNFVALDQEQPCREFILASESTSIQTLASSLGMNYAVQGGGVE